MSAPHHHLPQRHLNLLPSQEPKTAAFSTSPNISDRFSQLLNEIEVFLLACTYEEMCKFWSAIANLRNCFQNRTHHSEVPKFLSTRRRQRDFCRILEVLADLNYPHMHLSNHCAKNSGDRPQQTSFRDYTYLATQR